MAPFPLINSVLSQLLHFTSIFISLTPTFTIPLDLKQPCCPYTSVTYVKMRFLALCLALVPALAAPLNEPGSSDGINGYGNGNNGNGNNGNGNNGNGNNGNGNNGNGNNGNLNNGNGLNGNGLNGNSLNGNGNGPVCNAGLLYTQAQCCSTGVLGLADLDCKPARK